MQKLTILVSFLFLINFNQVHAYLPPAKMILQRMVENSGSGVYKIEQDLEFETQAEPITVKETWIIDGENQMRLMVAGQGQYANNIIINNLYVNGTKWTNENGTKKTQKISSDFFQKYFHARSLESLASFLQLEKIIDAGAFYKKPAPKRSQDFKYEAPQNLRLARSNGVINYYFGVPTAENQNQMNSGLWVEQDLFVLRKIRLNSGAEITADNYTNYAKNLHYPKSIQVKWEDYQVNIRVNQVSSYKKDANTFSSTSLELSVIKEDENLKVLYDFYSRLR